MTTPAFSDISAAVEVVTGDSITLLKPPNLAVGDCIELLFSWNNASSVNGTHTFTAPSGFVLRGTHPSSAPRGTAAFFKHIPDAAALTAESGTTDYTVDIISTGGTGFHICGFSARLTDSNGALSSVAPAHQSANSNALTFGTLTTPVDECLYVALVDQRRQASITFDAPLVEHAEGGAGTGTSNEVTCAFGSLGQAVAGVVVEQSASSSQTRDWRTMAYIIEPAGGAGDTAAPVPSVAAAIDSFDSTSVTLDTTAADAVESDYDYYEVAVLSGAGKPTDAQIKDGTGGGIVASNKALAVANGVEASVTITGLSPSTAYDFYRLYSDGTNDDSSFAALSQTTASAADTTDPIIVVTGGTKYVAKDSTFTEAMARLDVAASDNVDGDLTVNIALTNPVDTSTPGSYTLLFDVDDAASNSAAQQSRAIVVFDWDTQPSTFIGDTDTGADSDISILCPLAASIALIGTPPTDVTFDGVELSHNPPDDEPSANAVDYQEGFVFRATDDFGNTLDSSAFNIDIRHPFPAVVFINGGHTTIADQVYAEYGPDIGGQVGDHIVGIEGASGIIDAANAPAGIEVEYLRFPEAGPLLAGYARYSYPSNQAPGTYQMPWLYMQPSVGFSQITVYDPLVIEEVEEVVTELIGTALFELEGTWTASPIFTSIASGSFAEAQGASIGDWIEVEPANWSVDETGVLTMTGALPQTGQFRNMSSTSEGANQSHTRADPAADTNPPVITLNGPAVVNRLPGGTYTDAGATAEDAIDGAVAVQVTNPVDPLVIASVAVRYNAVDSDGNQATEVLRAVNTVGLAAAQINASGDQVELTFIGVMTAGADGASGWVAKVGGESIPLTYISGLGTSSLLFSPSRVILDDEVVALDFVQPGAGLSNPVGLMQGQTDFAVNNDSSIGAAPLLTALAVSDIGASFATLTLSTNVNNGSIAFASREGGGQLTPAQIKAATGASFRQVTQVGTQNLGNIAGLAAGTTYSVDVVHTTSQGVDSLVSSIAFSTLSAPPLQIAVIPVIPVIVGVSINPVNLAEYFDNTAVTFGIESGALLDGIALSGSVVSGVASTFTPLDVVFFAQNSAGQKTLSNVVTQAVADSLPDLFQIPHVPDVEPSVLVVSSSVVPTGYSSPTQIIATNGAEVSISGGAFVQSGTIVPGQSFRARIMASPDFLTVKTGVVSVGGRSVVFSVTTRASDALPEGFEFGYLGNAVRSAVYLSETSVVAGVDAGIDLPISIINGRYRINNGSFTTAAGLVRLGDSVQVEVTSSVEYGVTTQAQVNLVGVVSAFSVTTLRDPSIGDATPAGAVIREQVISLGVTL